LDFEQANRSNDVQAIGKTPLKMLVIGIVGFITVAKVEIKIANG
jgi:hypothetical protein